MLALRTGWNRLRTRARGSAGQSTAEYMLFISVIVIAIVAATYDPMHQALQDGSQQWQGKVTNASSKGGFGVQNPR